MVKLESETLRRLRSRLLEPRFEPAPESAAGPGPEQEAALERVGPVAETLFLMMVADDRSAREEHIAVHNAIHLLTDGLLPESLVGELLGRFEESLADQGLEARLEAIATRLALDRRDAEAAFSLAAALAMADEAVNAKERELLETLRSWLGIPRRRAAALLGEE